LSVRSLRKLASHFLLSFKTEKVEDADLIRVKEILESKVKADKTHKRTLRLKHPTEKENTTGPHNPICIVDEDSVKQKVNNVDIDSDDDTESVEGD